MSETIVVALVGLTGAIVGGVMTLAGNVLVHCLKERTEAKRDAPRKRLLVEMLQHSEHRWRNLGTLMHVIGADSDTTKRLLLEVGARASEDGKPLWGLTSPNPLPTGRP
jgi:hypothetical protein